MAESVDESGWEQSLDGISTAHQGARNIPEEDSSKADKDANEDGRRRRARDIFGFLETDTHGCR